MGKRQHRNKGRNIHGILLLDKPAGLTSNEALQKAKRLFDARKAGHTGSLDKMATGLLPLCFGEATKFTSYLLEADKRYLTRFRLGQETTTGDALGQVTSTSTVADIDHSGVEGVLKKFEGRIKQVPPMYSALKKDGKRLYELAYQGIEVEREPREITIYEITLIEMGRDFLELDIRCSKGTYIRTLAEDIGRELGCGAHVAGLRRTATGPFTEEQMLGFPELEQIAEAGNDALDATLKKVDAALVNLPAVELATTVSDYLCDGQPVTVPHAPTAGMLRIYTDKKDFIGVGEVLEDGRVAPRRLIINAH